MELDARVLSTKPSIRKLLATCESDSPADLNMLIINAQISSGPTLASGNPVIIKPNKATNYVPFHGKGRDWMGKFN